MISRPALRYHGGKWRLADRIIELAAENQRLRDSAHQAIEQLLAAAPTN